MKKVISCVLLMLVLTSNALALEVPTDTVVQNLNGSQQAIKTFTVSPEQDPAALIEEPFELEGYLYTFADIVKSENPVEETQIHTEVITVETTKDDLALILEQLISGYPRIGSHQSQYRSRRLCYEKLHGDGNQNHRTA